MTAARCEHCGTLDERGPHTLSNCRGVIQWQRDAVIKTLDARRYDESRSVALIGFARALRVARDCEEFRKYGDPHDLKIPALKFFIGVCMGARAKNLWEAAFRFAEIRWG